MFTPPDFNAFGPMFEQLFAQNTSHARDAAKSWAEHQRNILQQYRQALQRQLEHDPWDEAMQSLTKLLMTSFMEAGACQREMRRKSVEAQIAMADRLLEMLEQVGCKPPPPSESGKSDDRTATPS